MAEDPLMDRWRRALGKAGSLRAQFDEAEETARRTGVLLRNAEAELAAATESLRAAEEQAEAEERVARARAAEADDSTLDWQHR